MGVDIIISNETIWRILTFDSTLSYGNHFRSLLFISKYNGDNWKITLTATFSLKKNFMFWLSKIWDSIYWLSSNTPAGNQPLNNQMKPFMKYLTIKTFHFHGKIAFSPGRSCLATLSVKWIYQIKKKIDGKTLNIIISLGWAYQIQSLQLYRWIDSDGWNSHVHIHVSFFLHVQTCVHFVCCGKICAFFLSEGKKSSRKFIDMKFFLNISVKQSVHFSIVIDLPFIGNYTKINVMSLDSCTTNGFQMKPFVSFCMPSILIHLVGYKSSNLCHILLGFPEYLDLRIIHSFNKFPLPPLHEWNCLLNDKLK